MRRRYRTATLIIAKQELAAALRGRMILAFGGLFATLAIGIALAGLGASGQLLVQGFTRTAVSLLTLALYLLPMLGLILGASAFGGDDGGAELLLAQPISRAEALAGRALGLAAALSVVALGGFALAGVVVLVGAGAMGAGGFLLAAFGATLVGLVGLSIGVLIGIVVRRRGAAVGWALAAWVIAAVLFDLAAIAVLQLAGDGQPGPWLVTLLALNPIDGVRALALVGLGADVLLGPTGAALHRMLGPGGGAFWVAGSLVMWLVVPSVAGAAVFRRRDF
ncbi:MAG TPA: ABC transporter permease subunit [Gemmatimonadaceae bacterium]|jgi:Cu-processing system permease protein